MPNRIIKESILTSESIDALVESAEILFYRLLVTADDKGRFMASPSYLLSALYPLKAENLTGKKFDAKLRQIAADCGSLSDVGIIRLYSVKGRQYGYFIQWKDHQRIRHVRPKHPDPPEYNNNKDLGNLPQSADISPQNDYNPPRPAAESAPNPNPNPNLNPKKDICVLSDDQTKELVDIYKAETSRTSTWILTPERKKKLLLRAEDGHKRGVDPFIYCRQAMLAITRSKYHRGQNDQQKTYWEWTRNIFKSEEHTESLYNKYLEEDQAADPSHKPAPTFEEQVARRGGKDD